MPYRVVVETNGRADQRSEHPTMSQAACVAVDLADRLGKADGTIPEAVVLYDGKTRALTIRVFRGGLIPGG